MFKQTLRIAQTIAQTKAEGPGLRYAVWVQGGPIRCKACRNPEMFNPKRGRGVGVDTLAQGCTDNRARAGRRRFNAFCSRSPVGATFRAGIERAGHACSEGHIGKGGGPADDAFRLVPARMDRYLSFKNGIGLLVAGTDARAVAFYRRGRANTAMVGGCADGGQKRGRTAAAYAHRRQAYRVRVADSVRRHVVLDDAAQTRLELLPVLPADRLRQLLADELQRAGFELQALCARYLETDGVEIHVDITDLVVTVRLRKEAEICAGGEKSASIIEEQLEGSRAMLQKKLKTEWEARADQAQRQLQQAVTDTLKRTAADLQMELDHIVNRATVAALEEKAAQMGHIEEISEDGAGSMTIRIRL